MYHYAFVSTLPDLMDAHEAHVTDRTGIRRWIRWFPIGMGWAWLAGAALTLSSEKVSTAQTVIWFLLGSGVLYWFLLKPVLERRAIRAGNAKQQPVELHVDESGLRADVEGVGSFKRKWTELAHVLGAKRGVSLTFDDGTVNWLPNRVFEPVSEKQRFVHAVEEWARTALEQALRERLAKEEAWGLTEDEFWQLIDLFDREKFGDDDAVIEPAVQALSERNEQAIRGFQEHLADQLHQLDREELARNIGVGSYGVPDVPFSEERFLEARCVVVANGWEATRVILDYPESLQESLEFRALLDVAPKAWERKTGQSFEHVPETDYAAFANEHGWPSR